MIGGRHTRAKQRVIVTEHILRLIYCRAIWIGDWEDDDDVAQSHINIPSIPVKH